MIFDTHSHYLSHRFDDDRDEVLSHLPQKNVAGIIDCGTDFITSQGSLALADKYSYVYAAAGIHPESLIEKDASTIYKYKGDWEKELADIEDLLSHPKCVAVGECGLDYHWPVPKAEQNAMFKAHLELAKKHNKPIIIHDREAHGDTYAFLEEYKPFGVLHCFSGSAEDAARLTKNGLHIGFGGALTFKNAKKAAEAAAAIPLDKILLETDCPYMSPEPFRKSRCDSSLIDYTAQRLAEIKGLSKDEILKITCQNAKNLFL